MPTLVFDRHNISLEYENDCLIIREPEQPPRTLPLSHIDKMVCLHSVQLTTSLLGQLWQRGIDFVVLNNRYSERSFGLYPQQQRQAQRRCQQYQWQQNNQHSLELAIQLCQHRLKECMRLVPESANPGLHLCLQQLHTTMSLCTSPDELRGVEGTAQRLLFEHWRQQLPASLGFQRRQRRPPPDPVNALLSLSYTLVMQEAVRQCLLAGLDPWLGFYHRPSPGRYSLACDLMEPVRPAIEQWVMECFTNRLLDRRHFSHSAGQPCLLGKNGREIFYRAIDPMLGIWQKQLQATARWIARRVDQSTPLPEPAHEV